MFGQNAIEVTVSESVTCAVVVRLSRHKSPRSVQGEGSLDKDRDSSTHDTRGSRRPSGKNFTMPSIAKSSAERRICGTQR